jgi:hypothetical protein
MVKLNKIFLDQKVSFIVILLLIPILSGWEKTTIGEVLALKKTEQIERREQEKLIQEEISKLDIKPLRIIQKMQSAMSNSLGLKGKMNIWIQHPGFHMNIFLNQQFEDINKIYVVGQTSFCPTVASSEYSTSFFTSEWIQGYNLGALSYVFNPEKKLWQRHKIKLSNEEKLKIVEYDIFQSLAMPRPEFLETDSVKIVSLQDLKGKRCFVLEFRLDHKKIEKLLKVGSIDKYKVWIDRETFLPYLFRLEGSIGEMEFLQTVEYFDFNVPVKLSLPPEINKDIESQKLQMVQRIGEICKEIRDLRGYVKEGNFKHDFIDYKKLREIVNRDLDVEYTAGEMEKEGIIFKWLGFLPEEFDYREWLLDSTLRSVGGLYDPKEKTLFLSECLPEHLAESVLSHELTHAFQDQVIDLVAFQKVKNNLDEFYARHFLLEGEATAVMLQLLWTKSNRKLEDEGDLLSEIKARFSLAEKSLDDKARDLFFSGYGYGARFIQKAIQNYGWRNLDKLYNSVPVSMSEIMHPAIYFYKKERKKLTELNFSAVKNWQTVYQNSLGEFIVLMWLQMYLDSKEADNAASGLEDDKIIVYVAQDNKRLIALFAQWESEKDASEFLEAFQKLEDKKMKGDDKKIEEANYRIWHLDNKDELIASYKNLTLIASGQTLKTEEIGTLLGLLKH